MDLLREHYRELFTSHPNSYTLSLKLEVLAIVMGGGGGCKEFLSLKRGGHKKLYLILKVGEQKVSDPQFSHFVAPPPRN